VELLLPYIRSVVGARAFCKCQADYDDAVSDSCEALLVVVSRAGLPYGGFEAFRAGVRTVVLRRLIRRREDSSRRLRTEARYAQTVSESMNPLRAAIIAESLDMVSRERLVEAMLSRSRFAVVTADLCRRTADWMGLQERRRRPLARELKDCGFWDRGFLARYLQTLYCWSCHELREEVLAS